MTQKRFLISVLATLCLSFSACDDEAVNNMLDGLACDSADVRCDENIAVNCNEGITKNTDCKENVCNVVDGVAICQPKTEEPPASTTCTEADNKCIDDHTYSLCVMGVPQEGQCTGGKICTGNGRCKEPCTARCDDATNSKVTCGANGEEVSQACGNTETCTMVEDVPTCEPKTCKNKCENNTKITCDANGQEVSQACGNTETCTMVEDVPTCLPKPAFVDGGIGDPCTCTGDNCENVITGAEIRQMLPADMLPAEALTMLAILLQDTDNTTGPNFFAGDSIKGCEKVEVPEGMTLGCVRTSNVKFSTGLAGVATILGALEASETLPQTLIDAIKLINEKILTPGLSFEADNGYCTVGAMSVTGQMEGLDMNTFFGKINAGDYTSAKAAACPEDSVMLNYGMTDQLSGGFVMCAKSCDNNDDCRVSDGYSCEHMPTAFPTAGQAIEDMPHAKVCVDNDNIVMMNSMLEAFTSLMEDVDAGTNG